MRKITVVLVALCALACHETEKTGSCWGCCDTVKIESKANFTRKMCEDYNTKKVDGHIWTFAEGIAPCPPSTK